MPESIPQDHIRNFCIIAHIDHGKSTLADRILAIAGAISEREMREQLLDDMDLERERGITIKAKAVSFTYELDGETYLLNLIDTPGHVDFHYEVSRSMAACEGALLLVDACQGVEAQTVANAYLAIGGDLEMLPVLNKIDMNLARPEEVREEIEASLGLDTEGMLHVSAKTGEGVEELMRTVIERFPPPKGDDDAPLRALIFDSTYDVYRGAIIFLRVIDGRMKTGDTIEMLGTGDRWDVNEVGIFAPEKKPKEELRAGEVGYLIANIKGLTDVQVGDTITAPSADVAPLPGYKVPSRMVFCGLYPTNNKDFPALRKALEKLQLNDSSFSFQPESSEALGFGFRCGFLGLLHMEIVQERLERESNIDLVQTAPNVTYQIIKTDNEELWVDSPADVPEPHEIEEFREPIVRANVICPSDYIGAIMQLNEDHRGSYVKTEYVTPKRVIIVYDLPLSEIIYDYYDKLKSYTRGYGTLDYELTGYEDANLVRLDILVNKTEVDALSMIVHADQAESRGRELLKILKKKIPRHLFKIPLQAAIGSKIVARENISAMRKNVTAKCYGGDISRKRKLLEKQKEGKKRMKAVGNVEIPQEAFLAALKAGGGDTT